jgi:hypothetical protein
MEQLFRTRTASVSDHTMEGWTALHVAVAGRKFDSCQFPLRHDAEVGATGHIGLTQLHLAAAYGHIGVVKLLL